MEHLPVVRKLQRETCMVSGFHGNHIRAEVRAEQESQRPDLTTKLV